MTSSVVFWQEFLIKTSWCDVEDASASFQRGELPRARVSMQDIDRKLEEYMV